MEPIRKCQKATKFIITKEGFYIPSQDSSGVPMTLMQVPDPTKVQAPPVCMEDLLFALTKVKKTVSKNDLK